SDRRAGPRGGAGAFSGGTTSHPGGRGTRRKPRISTGSKRRATPPRPSPRSWKGPPKPEHHTARVGRAGLYGARKRVEMGAAAILALIERLDGKFACAVELLRNCRGRVILTGMGKSGIICRKIAATLTSTGTPSFFLHPAEAIHGDLGVIQKDDVVVALSYSGET